MTTDQDYLRLLSIFHYVVGGMAGLCGCFPIIHLAVGIGIASGAFNTPGTPGPPPEFGWLFAALAAAAMLLSWTLAIGLVVAGWMLQQRRGYLFCLVMAGFACLFQPFGIILGVFTIIVLVRPGVKALFERNRPEWGGLAESP